MLPKQERKKLAKAIVRSMRAELKAADFTDKQKAELDRRSAAAKRDPSDGSTWDEVEARILGKR